MSFLNNIVFGARIWVWLYLAFSIFGFLGVVIYIKRELIRMKYYAFRFPEKLLKVIIHYKSGYFKEYWRLIPDDEKFLFHGQNYFFDDKNIIKENDFYAKKKGGENLQLIIEDKKYDLKKLLKIKGKGKKYPEIHYLYNAPSPLDFDFNKKVLDFSSKTLKEFKDNDLFGKLLTLEDEKNLLKMIMIIGIINLVATVFIVLHLTGVLTN